MKIFYYAFILFIFIGTLIFPMVACTDRMFELIDKYRFKKTTA